MKARIILIIAIYFLSTGLFGQTKLIAHKSHSGSIENCRISLEKNLFDIKDSNFGMAPQPVVKTAKLDSVIYISDTVAIMITSNYCENKARKISTLWRAGRDTVYAHPLFSKKHALDSIKRVLKENYYFKNNINSVKFIGYDNKREEYRIQKKKNYIIPVSANNESEEPPPFDGQVYIMVGIIAVLSVLAGLFSWVSFRVRKA